MKLDIKRLGINGEGVGIQNEKSIQDNKVCFVSGALPNEIVEASISVNKKKFNICKLEKVLSKSENRVVPKCPYFEKCGGCELQHMNNELQVVFKKNKVEDTNDNNSTNEYPIPAIIKPFTVCSIKSQFSIWR